MARDGAKISRNREQSLKVDLLIEGSTYQQKGAKPTIPGSPQHPTF